MSVEASLAAEPASLWVAAGGTHVGKVRSLNEDAFFVGRTITVVADGMGGHEAGEVASNIVVATLRELDGAAVPLSQIEAVVDGVNSRVRSVGRESGHPTMGTTAVGLVAVHNGDQRSVVLFNVGDSRCYQWTKRQGLRQLSKDHSLVQELVDQGIIGSDEAATHPKRNVVTRAIGIEDHIAVDFVVVSSEPNTRLLLCSDGVSGELSDAAIEKAIGTSPTPSHAVDSILASVLEGRARDNLTAVVVDLMVTMAAPDASLDDVTGPRPSPSVIDPLQSPHPDGATVENGGTMVIDDVPGLPKASDAPNLPAPTGLIDDVPQ
jgi:PPM family protein phosphatase